MSFSFIRLVISVVPSFFVLAPFPFLQSSLIFILFPFELLRILRA
jgi:hypothetical protein